MLQFDFLQVPYMKQTFIIANMFLATTFLGPILYQVDYYFNFNVSAGKQIYDVSIVKIVRNTKL